MKTLWFIRHDESLSKAGFPTETPHEIGLSEKALGQAEALARQWRTVPELIVVSRYTRTAATAPLLCLRRPQVPVLLTIQSQTQHPLHFIR